MKSASRFFLGMAILISTGIGMKVVGDLLAFGERALAQSEATLDVAEAISDNASKEVTEIKKELDELKKEAPTIAKKAGEKGGEGLVKGAGHALDPKEMATSAAQNLIERPAKEFARGAERLTGHNIFGR